MEKEIKIPEPDPWKLGFDLATSELRDKRRIIAILEAMRIAEINGRNFPLDSFRVFLDAYCFTILDLTHDIENELTKFEKECLDKIFNLGY